MTQEELEFNKSCAEFLNIITDNGYWVEFDKLMPNSITMSYSKNHHIEQLQFHSDWNWIHEVIGKVKTSVKLAPMNGITDSIMPYINAKHPVIKFLLDNDKEGVVQGIKQFLIWYNETEILPQS